MNDQQIPAEQGSVSLARTDRATLLVRFIGPWHLKRNVPSAKVVERELRSSLPVKRLSFDTSEVTNGDSGLIGVSGADQRSMPRTASATHEALEAFSLGSR